MELSNRMKYFTFIILGVVFVITGFALNELDILAGIDFSNVDSWYNFLAPWVATPDTGGLPIPWGQ